MPMLRQRAGLSDPPQLDADLLFIFLQRSEFCASLQTEMLRHPKDASFIFWRFPALIIVFAFWKFLRCF